MPVGHIIGLLRPFTSSRMDEKIVFSQRLLTKVSINDPWRFFWFFLVRELVESSRYLTICNLNSTCLRFEAPFSAGLWLLWNRVKRVFLYGHSPSAKVCLWRQYILASLSTWRTVRWLALVGVWYRMVHHYGSFGVHLRHASTLWLLPWKGVCSPEHCTMSFDNCTFPPVTICCPAPPLDS